MQRISTHLHFIAPARQLPAGTHTVRIESSWSYGDRAVPGVLLNPAGNFVVNLPHLILRDADGRSRFALAWTTTFWPGNQTAVITVIQRLRTVYVETLNNGRHYFRWDAEAETQRMQQFQTTELGGIHAGELLMTEFLLLHRKSLQNSRDAMLQIEPHNASLLAPLRSRFFESAYCKDPLGRLPEAKYFRLNRRCERVRRILQTI